MRQNNLVKFDLKKMITPKNKTLRSLGETINQNKKVTLQPNKFVSNQLKHQNIVNKPAFIHVPAIALKIALGEFSVEALGSSRVLPSKLKAAGFKFNQPDILSALNSALKY